MQVKGDMDIISTSWPAGVTLTPASLFYSSACQVDATNPRQPPKPGEYRNSQVTDNTRTIYHINVSMLNVMTILEPMTNFL